MADAASGRNPRSASSSSGSSRKKPPSRLQRQAPASLQISPSPSQWNVAIPLLTPVATSPISPPRLPVAVKSQEEEAKEEETESKKLPVVFKNWQHPATSFSYELGQRRPSSSVTG
ncbi:hypothetical protein SAY86_012248 [Trapa natans]|uniref:Uncharacterized protein n=1 Tax=Trapa natans TaxID=22666 RepID=A0AAN7R6W6_TRANT|nr:hypothetical protein SAY86_012248 [Trapa natans]